MDDSANIVARPFTSEGGDGVHIVQPAVDWQVTRLASLANVVLFVSIGRLTLFAGLLASVALLEACGNESTGAVPMNPALQAFEGRWNLVAVNAEPLPFDSSFLRFDSGFVEFGTATRGGYQGDAVAVWFWNHPTTADSIIGHYVVYDTLDGSFGSLNHARGGIDLNRRADTLTIFRSWRISGDYFEGAVFTYQRD